jgi:hypothetical protein
MRVQESKENSNDYVDNIGKMVGGNKEEVSIIIIIIICCETIHNNYTNVPEQRTYHCTLVVTAGAAKRRITLAFRDDSNTNSLKVDYSMAHC